MPSSYTHEAKNTKGSNTPDTVAAGLGGVKSTGGSSATPETSTPSGSQRQPSSVKNNDGASNMSPRESRDAISTTPVGGAKNRIPAAVSKFPPSKP